MTDRSDGGGEVVPPRDSDMTDRLAVIARLRPGSRERAIEILANGAPYELGEAGFRRHSVFLAEEDVVFLFEGAGAISEWQLSMPTENNRGLPPITDAFLVVKYTALAG